MSMPELYVGLMSGTSLDGVDAVLVDLSGSAPQLLTTHYRPYGTKLKADLLALHQPAHDELHQAMQLGNKLAREYAAATTALLQTASVAPSQIRALGCHGQTIRHRPDAGYTVQLGNAALLAELSGITVISDFRSRDIAASGQGAPLVPAFHGTILRHPAAHRVIVNIGGISNLTDLPPQGTITGFDCGPGNVLMDAWIMRHRHESYDKDGAWAASGRIIPQLLQTLLQEPFLHAAPPKSSGRELFNLAWLEKFLAGGEAPEDVQATLLAFSAQAIANAIRDYCRGAQEIYLCGGGARNRELCRQLAAALPECSVQPTDVLGTEAEWMEAIAFAWLAQQALHGHPLDLSAITGARHPCILGSICQA
jgi:anhydro-N-acetylmuramic acid kinase